jgi:UPF0716 protein FxsA
MVKWLFLAFLVVPALEIFTIIQVGQVIGGWPTFFLIVGLSFLGAYLVKVQGRRTLRQIQRDLTSGVMPGDALLDGACLLVGGTLLLTPGFLTDALGLFLLLPGMRQVVKRLIKLWLVKKLRSGNWTIYRRW